MFGLDHPNYGGIHVLIFVSCIKLDLGSQTVLLDAAVPPLTRDLVVRIGKFLQAIAAAGFVQSR